MKVLLHALDGEESLMSAKPLMLLVPAAATAGLVLGPVAANAAEMHQPGTWGKPAGTGVRVSNLTCGGMPGGAVHVPQMSLPHVPSKTINIYKPVTITGTIDASRNTSSPRISTIRKPSMPRSMSRSTSRRRPKVPDCTERTNLRKWGTGDMLFTCVMRVCLDPKREMTGGASRLNPNYRITREQWDMAATAANQGSRAAPVGYHRGRPAHADREPSL